MLCFRHVVFLVGAKVISRKGMRPNAYAFGIKFVWIVGVAFQYQ